MFEVIEGGRQEALLASQSPIPEADREDSEERPMEVIEATKAAATSEAMATGDNGVVFGNGNGVVVDGMEMEEENGLNGGHDDFILKTPAPSAAGDAMDVAEPPSSVGQGRIASRVNMI